MSLCQYCREKAGLFRNEHLACAEKARIGITALEQIAHDAVLNGEPASEVIPRMTALVDEARIPVSAAERAAISGLNSATSERARKATLSPPEFDNIYALYCHFNYDFAGSSNVELKHYGFAYAGLSNILWHVQQGTPLPYDGAGRAQFNLGHGEIPIYCFGATTLAEEKTVRSGGYAGISVPIGDGIRVNTGSFGSNRVTGLVPLDEGDFLMTNQGLYFGGAHKTLHLPYKSILRFQPYIDGVGVYGNSGGQKVFVQPLKGAESGWFINELIQLLKDGDVPNSA